MSTVYICYVDDVETETKSQVAQVRCRDYLLELESVLRPLKPMGSRQEKPTS